MGARSWCVIGVVTCAVAAGVNGAPESGAVERGAAAKAPGSVAIVQAVPDVEMVVTVDGDQVGEAMAEGAVVPPLSLAAGEHEVEFTFDDGTTVATVDVQPGASSDVVVHRPADVGGEPVVSVYPSPVEPIGPGKARVVLAHTATTAPADVAVDDQTVFTNIANGEYAEADVAAGSHRVALLPSGVEGPPILGPLDVNLKAGTLTSVYAIGNPRSRSMDVIVRETRLPDDGSTPPTRVETGSAGLVADLRVLTFAAGG